MVVSGNELRDLDDIRSLKITKPPISEHCNVWTSLFVSPYLRTLWTGAIKCAPLRGNRDTKMTNLIDGRHSKGSQLMKLKPPIKKKENKVKKINTRKDGKGLYALMGSIKKTQAWCQTAPWSKKMIKESRSTTKNRDKREEKTCRENREDDQREQG